MEVLSQTVCRLDPVANGPDGPRLKSKDSGGRVLSRTRLHRSDCGPCISGLLAIHGFKRMIQAHDRKTSCQSPIALCRLHPVAYHETGPI